MFLYTSVQTNAIPQLGDYPTREKKAYDNNISYSQFEEVALYENNSIYTSLADNNQGNYPATSSDYWVFKEKLSVYRPIQPIPKTRIVKTGGFTYGLGTSNATHIVILGAFGKDITVYEVDDIGNIISSSTQSITSDADKYLFELTNKVGEQKIRVKITSNASDEMAGFLLVRGFEEHQLDNTVLKCKKCSHQRYFAKETSQYNDDGYKIDGSSKIVQEKEVSLIVPSTEKDTISELLTKVIDTPVFLIDDKTQVNNGIYGVYSSYDVNENCDNGNISFSGTIKSFPYNPPSAIKDVIYPPQLINCFDVSTPTGGKMRGITVQAGNFLYSGAGIKTHHSTDWVLKDSGGSVLVEYPMVTGQRKTLYIEKIPPAGNYTVEVTYRDQNGNISQTATKDFTVDSDACYGACPNVFRDNSMKFMLPFSSDQATQYEFFNGGSWTVHNHSDAYIVQGGDTCYSTYMQGNAYCSVDNKDTIPYRFDRKHNTEITLCFWGYFMNNEANYCFPYVIRYGSLLITMNLDHPSKHDNYPDCSIWLESNTKSGEGSPQLHTGYTTPVDFEFYAVYANLMTRTVKFFVNGKLVKDFYNVANTGTSGQFNDAYDLGARSAAACTKRRGHIRSLLAFNRELTEEELWVLQCSARTP